MRYILLLVMLLQAGAQALQQLQLPIDTPCYTGIAQLRLIDDKCSGGMQKLSNLSSPFDPSKDLPWDCLNDMAVSVEGCKVTMVSMRNASTHLFNFSCSWFQYSGRVVNGTTARLAPWIAPIAVARYLLRYTDLGDSSSKINAAGKPDDWQQQLEEMLSRRRLALIAVPGTDQLVLTQNQGQCNTTFEVVSGGLLGVGKINSSSIGQAVMPSWRPFQPPIVIKGERPRPWAARARAVFIALIVVSAVMGAMLLSCLGLLIVRLVRASKSGAMGPLRGCPFEDGVGRVANGSSGSAVNGIPMHSLDSLEHQSRRHGPSGGI